jgi:putative glutamine amidotransferase
VTIPALQSSPVIGITSYSLEASWGSWREVAANLLPARYCTAVAGAGGLPVLLPPLAGVSDVLGRLDGLILSGGGDLDPALYGATPHEATGGLNPARDDAELSLCAAAISAGLPVLGICRGMQVINVALGGSLHQHVPDLVGSDMHSPEVSAYGQHQVAVSPGSRLASVLGRTELTVPTHHHQAVDRLGRGLVPTAWTADQVIEAAEFAADNDRTQFMLAVQWHPEAGDDHSLFAGLVAAAADRAADRPMAGARA